MAPAPSASICALRVLVSCADRAAGSNSVKRKKAKPAELPTVDLSAWFVHPVYEDLPDGWIFSWYFAPLKKISSMDLVPFLAVFRT